MTRDDAAADLAPDLAARAIRVAMGTVATCTGVAVALRGTAAIPGGAPTVASNDSVLRFYAVWWAAQGPAMWRLARGPGLDESDLRRACTTMFLGGVARLASMRAHPPENAIVLSVDEKSQIQALNRTQKVLPMQPGHAEPTAVDLRTHDYVRNGTTTLFAALEIATGKVTGLCKDRHRHQEFLIFLRHLARAYPDRGDGVELHLVMDNYATHKRPEVKAWLAANPRIHIHFTPTSGSWFNLVEVWFGIIERQALRRGTFRTVRDLNTKIRTFINGWNTPDQTRT